MIKERIETLYNKYRSHIENTLKSDNFYSDFIDIIRAGKRVYTQHNVYLERKIDEDWVKAIETAIPHLSTIINNPRQFLQIQEEVVPIELARKINANSIRHLSSHTHFIRSVEKDSSVIPSKILSFYNDDTLNIYENRFIMTLLSRLDDFVSIRYLRITDDASDKNKACDFGVKGTFTQNGEVARYNLQMKIDQEKGHSTDYGDVRPLIERIEKIRGYIADYNETVFVRSLKSVPLLKPPINRTNLMLKSPDYSACLELWSFLDEYTKPGYSVKVVDTNPIPDENVVGESEFMVLLYYSLLKNNMPGSHTDEKEFLSQKTIYPQVVRRYNTNHLGEFNSEFPNHNPKAPPLPGGMPPRASDISDILSKSKPVQSPYYTPEVPQVPTPAPMMPTPFPNQDRGGSNNMNNDFNNNDFRRDPMQDMRNTGDEWESLDSIELQNDEDLESGWEMFGGNQEIEGYSLFAMYKDKYLTHDPKLVKAREKLLKDRIIKDTVATSSNKVRKS